MISSPFIYPLRLESIPSGLLRLLCSSGFLVEASPMLDGGRTPNVKPVSGGSRWAILRNSAETDS